eukprot:127937-Hanusia_phi.AAC.1
MTALCCQCPMGRPRSHSQTRRRPGAHWADGRTRLLTGRRRPRSRHQAQCQGRMRSSANGGLPIAAAY